MREGWKEIEFGQIATFRNGLNYSKSNHGEGCKIISVSDFKDRFKPIYDTLGEINPKGIVRDNHYLLAGDILFVRSNGNKNLVGRSLFIDENCGVVFSGFCIRARFTSKDILPLFYAYFCQTTIFRKLISNASGGTNIQNLNQSILNKVKVFLPPLQTQKKIASILSAYDDLIENNLRRIQLLEEQAQQTYEEWFVRIRFPGFETAEWNEETGLPVGWRKVKLKDFAEINKMTLKKGFQENIKYIDIASVSTNRINSFTEYNYNKAPGRAKRILRHGDIIWSCVRPNRKSYAVVWKPEENLIASTGFCVISPKQLPTSYLYHYLTTDSFVNYLTNLAGGAAYPAVKSIDFEDADIIVPGIELITKYDNKIKGNLESSWNLQNQNRLLKEARDLLLPRLMMGMIDVEN